MPKTTTPKDRQRNRYNEETQRRVRQIYPHIKTATQKRAFAHELGMRTEKQLYNLSSRLAITCDLDDRIAAGTAHPDELYDPRTDPARLLVRDDPQASFSSTDDQYLRDVFGAQDIAEIAWVLGRSETAVMLRARQLGLRRAVHYWELGHVLAWLGMSEKELHKALVRAGHRGAIHRCCDRRGTIRIALVESAALARALSHTSLWRSLIEQRNADRCFVRDLLESEAQVARGLAARESNRWISHGHTCLNPFSGVSFGLFYDGADDKLIGVELTPEQLSPRAVLGLLDYRGEQSPGSRLPQAAAPLSAATCS